MTKFWTTAGYCLLGLIVLGAIMRWVLVTYVITKSAGIEADKAKSGNTVLTAPPK